MNYSQAIHYLYNRLPVFHLKGGDAYKPGLSNTKKLLEGLGNPQLRFKSIHIAGTNGKGSVSNMLSAVLQSAGYKTGLYTSPHLVDFGERIRINGQTIEEDYVVDFVNRTADLVETISPSFFELTMAMAFDYFASHKVEIAIVEAGLGGRLDSTNILHPIVSIITNIAFDHVEFLGNDLGKIASEKAGIIKQGIPVVVGEYLPETKAVFLHKASELNAPIVFVQDKYTVDLLETKADYNLLKVNTNSYKLGLLGNYQLKNLPTVLESIEFIKRNQFEINNIDIENGLRNVSKLTGLRGRWEKLSQNPLIIADTAHNANGIEELSKQLAYMKFHKLHLITGVVKDKDLEQILNLLPKYASYYFTQAQIPRALDAEILKQKANDFGLVGNSYKSILLAINAALDSATEKDLIVIAGSNFVVGEALQHPLFLRESLD